MAAADRLLMQLAVITGIALVAAECLTSLRDVRQSLEGAGLGRRVLRRRRCAAVLDQPGHRALPT